MPLRPLSLTLRLTLLVAAASALVLFALGLLIGRSVEQHFIDMDRMILLSEGRPALSKLSAEPAASINPARIEQLQAELRGISIALYDESGSLVQSAPGLALDQSASDQLFARLSEPIKWQVNNQPWRGMLLPLSLSDGSKWYLLVAVDILHHEHFMQAFRRTLWIFISLAALLMGLLGWVAVRRGTAPLQHIKQKAAEITASNLHQRLAADRFPVELADLTAELNAMLARLEESFQRLSDFSADLAHELRTPVSNLLTQTQVTLAKPRDAEGYREALASNAEELELLSRMVSDMLFLAKAEAAQIIPNSEQLDLHQELMQLLEFFEALAQEREISLSLHGQAQIAGDRLMLRRAFANLISNALAYTPAGGRVEISIASGHSGARLQFLNTGADIPAEHLPRLFNRFYRADSARQRSTEGAGLGLAITRSIILAHGGSIAVESGGGRTVFEVRLGIVQ